MPDLDSTFEKLVSLVGEDALVGLQPYSPDGTIYLWWHSNGRVFAFEDPFRTVFEQIRRTEGRSLWPDMDPLSADFSLFSVHLMETIELAPDTYCLLRWGTHDLTLQPPRLPPAITVAGREKLFRQGGITSPEGQLS